MSFFAELMTSDLYISVSRKVPTANSDQGFYNRIIKNLTDDDEKCCCLVFDTPSSYAKN